MRQLIADIYRAAAGTMRWGTVLTQFTQEMELLGSQMVGVSSSSGSILFSHASDSVPSETELEYVRTYHADDPRIPLLLKRTSGDWLFDQDVFDPEVAENQPYYRDLLIPFGGRHTATAKLLDQDGELVLIGFLAHLAGPGFGRKHRLFLESITFHLREAAILYQKNRRLTTAAFAGTELLCRMPRPTWLLGVDRSLSFMNDSARRYLQDGKGLLLVRDRLSALDAQTDAGLSSAFQGIVDDLARTGVPKRRIVRLPVRGRAHPAALSLTAFVPESSMYAFGPKAQMLLIVHEPTLQNTPDNLLWEAAFNLTPSQSRVALELFKGLSTSEAARSLKIAESTVKSHLQELFAKTETGRQSQLVLALASFQ